MSNSALSSLAYCLWHLWLLWTRQINNLTFKHGNCNRYSWPIFSKILNTQ
ncbi:hypothetical protein I3842_09G156000 [Carya illinoinensis]|uniref:Uncharacterized protein n=1 Tax=Carya illinoinensis TaxID=32201 RepID=A0A922E5P8_CARIL|nr:hypothetical protein I3842_09G156000 [Carya illinoinensis]